MESKKKKFEAPKIEIIEFDSCDVIVTSDGSDGDDDYDSMDTELPGFPIP